MGETIPFPVSETCFGIFGSYHVPKDWFFYLRGGNGEIIPFPV